MRTELAIQREERAGEGRGKLSFCPLGGVAVATKTIEKKRKIPLWFSSLRREKDFFNDFLWTPLLGKK